MRRTRVRCVAAEVFGAIILFLGIALLSPAWAQQQSSPEQDEPTTSESGESRSSDHEPQSDIGSGVESPTRSPRFLPPIIRPTVLTPEELEEAERLRKLAARYGTDPTAIVGRLQASSQYLDLERDAQSTVTTARVDVPFRRSYLLRIEMPFLRTIDPNGPTGSSMRGMSDLSVTAGWRAYYTPEYALLVGAVGTFPTAAEAGLGFGKYTVGPAIATARFLPRWESFLIGLVQYHASVGGDPSRKEVSLLSAVAQVNSFWAEHWWTVAQAVWKVDFERNAKSSMVLELEMGRNLVKTLGIFARPGIGIWGQSLPGAFQWNIEVGIRYMFGSF